jgi:hypothetical protein
VWNSLSARRIIEMDPNIVHHNLFLMRSVDLAKKIDKKYYLTIYAVLLDALNEVRKGVINIMRGFFI